MLNLQVSRLLRKVRALRKMGWFSELDVQIATFNFKVPLIGLSELGGEVPFRMGVERLM